MSAPRLYAIGYILGGIALALGIPVVVALYIGDLVAVPVAIFTILFMMSISLAELSLAAELGDTMDLGPSFLAGFGLLNYGMLVRPLLTLPGLPYLYVLPVDEQGYVDSSKWFSLDEDKIKPPHHD